MHNENLAFFVGLIIGAALTLLLMTALPISIFKLAQTALNECESQLPRDQVCIITATPEIKDVD